MKYCPQCHQHFEDASLALCPHDKTYLLDEGTPNNPRNMQVRPVDESAETRMFDIESIRNELDSVPADVAPTILDSGEGTNMLSRQQVVDAMRGTAVTATRTVEGDQTKTVAPQAAPANPRRKNIVIAIAIGSGIGLLAIVVAAYLFLPRISSLHIVSAPQGAKVEIDGVLSGVTPVKAEVPAGKHKVSVLLDGYLPFAQIVDVPRRGMPLTVALVKADRTEAPSSATSQPADQDVIAAAQALVVAINALLDVDKVDEAETKFKTLAELVPHDERLKVLAERIAAARNALNKVEKKYRGLRTSGKPLDDSDESINKMSKKEREKRADQLYREGQKLYKSGDSNGAKQILLRAVRFDPRFYPPHRVLARIYNREKNVEKAKYHLTRYIELGGADQDYKIRQWLATH